MSYVPLAGKFIKLILFCAISSISVLHTCGQNFPIRKDSVESIFRNTAAFTIYKNNYFITGMPLGQEVTKEKSDVKFQISFKQRLLNRPLPFGTYLHIIYTQRSFWNIYGSSSPFRESNYNPGFLLVRPIYKKNVLVGGLAFTLEHESNGRDSIYSRSWNFMSMAYSKTISKKLVAGLKIWIPFVAHNGNNTDLMKYIGYGELGLHYTISNKLFIDLAARKGTSGTKGSLQTDLSFKPWSGGNQYLVLQWWYGYAESLVDYNQGQSILRLGIMFKPTFYRFY